MACVTISEVIDKGINPPVLSFQNGVVVEERCEKFQSELFETKNGKPLVAVNSGDCVYSGELSDNEVFNTFVCIKNKHTNEVKLVSVNNVLLKPEVLRKRKIFDESLLNKSTNRDLSRQFGSKRSKRATEQIERLKLDVENIKSQLEETVVNVTIKEEELAAPAFEENTAFRPPINREAIEVEDVYILENLIPKDVLDSFSEEAKKLLEEDAETDQLNQIIKLEIANLRDTSSKNSNSTLDKANLWLYINGLISLTLTNAKLISKHNYECCKSLQANAYILNNFTQVTKMGRARPISMKDKTICYILVLAMIASDYKLNVEPYAKELKIGIKRLIELCRILSFTQTTNKSSFILKLPLPAPVIKTSPKKKIK